MSRFGDYAHIAAYWLAALGLIVLFLALLSGCSPPGPRVETVTIPGVVHVEAAYLEDGVYLPGEDWIRLTDLLEPIERRRAKQAAFRVRRMYAVTRELLEFLLKRHAE